MRYAWPMTRTISLALISLASVTAIAQQGFDTIVPDQPVILHVNSNGVGVTGHWVALDQKSELSGPSVSEINCDHRKCVESQANMTVMKDGTFGLSADTVEYTIERWTEREIVASNVGGLCRVRNVLKFDFVEKRVFSLQTLSEPIDERLPQRTKETCKAV